MHGSYSHGSREIPHLASEWHRGPRWESERSTTAMNGCGKSDSPIVAEKPSNNGWDASQPAERVEPRGLAKRESRCGKTGPGHSAGQGVNMDDSKRARSGKPRKQPRDRAYVDSPRPAKCAPADTAGCLPGQRYYGSRRSGTTSTTSTASERLTSASSGNAAPGVDGETWQHYGENLEDNLRDLAAG